MTSEKSEIIAITLLLSRPKAVEQGAVQHAAEFAFHNAPVKPTVVAVPGKPAHVVSLGPLRLGVINSDQPYFADVASVASRIPNVAARAAVQQHVGWLSVDLLGQPHIDLKIAIGLIGQLIAEFCDESVLGLMCRPRGPIIGYDFSFIPLLRMRKASDVFARGRPDRVVKTPANSEALAAAAQEAKRRWPEFVNAFVNRSRGDGFGVKKRFEVDGKVEHMWIDVQSIDGIAIRGLLANEAKIIQSLKLGDPVVVQYEEIEDWLYMRGKEQVGGFQARVLRKQP